MISQEAFLPLLFPGLKETVYAPKWYYVLSVKKDNYSHKLCYYSKKHDWSIFFYPYIKEVVDELNRGRLLCDLELITIIPSHEIDGHSPTLHGLAQELSEYLHVPWDLIIKRIKETRAGGQRLDNRFTRYFSIKDTMMVTRPLKETKILLLDDVKASGTTILESKKILLKAGVKETITICLGINSRIDRD
jgi:predicted amidophosphoribosyltransferase